MRKLISYETATEILAEQTVKRKKTETDIEQSLWQILAEDITAAFPMPPFDKSPFDGFAFRAEETPGTLKIHGECAAGCQNPEPLNPGTAVRIFTGAPIPEGADAVMKFEDTVVSQDCVTISDVIEPDTNIIRTGEDYPVGDRLVKAGTRLSPAEIGLIASQGLRKIPVFQKPKVLFLSTGTELSEPGKARPTYGIYNSSYYSLSSYLRCMNFDVQRGGIVDDDRRLITAKIAAGLQNPEIDLVITTGGASVGDYDFAVRAAEDLGLEILFWKVNMKPGGALMAARSEEKLYIALSGNPAAAMMSMLVVLQPYLRKLSGSNAHNEELTLPLVNSMPKTGSVVRMLRGHAVIRDGMMYFEEHPGRGNGHIASFEHCNLIGIVPGNTGPLKAGDRIRVVHLPEDLCC